MIPVLAIVGRPNVGKSTLFNTLTKTRQALVIDSPGVTRDRLYGDGVIGDIAYQLVDTCGVFGEQEQKLQGSMHAQLEAAIAEADLVMFMVDAKAGLMPEDIEFANILRQSNKKVALVVNKTDGLKFSQEAACAEFYSLGFEHVIPIAAAHKRGINQMMTLIGQTLGVTPKSEQSQPQDKALEKRHKIAVLGKPNVGKSTLINRMLRQERVVVYDMPGTTRDSIYIPFERFGKAYTLIDTAGLRRKSRVHEIIEKFSIIKTFQAVLDADTVIMVLNAQEEISDQDLKLLQHCLKVGRSIVIVVNKWDCLEGEQKIEFRAHLKNKLQFMPHVRIHTISALHGTGVGDLFELVENAHSAATQDLSTGRLTKLIEKAQAQHQPPMSKGRRIKLKYAHCVGQNPIKIYIHGNQTESLPDSYKRYMYKYISQELGLVGAPLHISYKTSDNPYKDKRNKLTPRQMHKRKRLMRHVKKKSKK